MWLERLGTVDERIFIGFGVVSGLIIVIGVINSLLVCCAKYRPPGHSVLLLQIYSTFVICAAVLFRGVQPSWGSLDSIRPLCPVFTALMLVGYTIFGASVMIQSWSVVIYYKMGSWKEWRATLTLWIFVIIAGAAVIVWVVVFSPDITWRNQNVSVYSQNIYVCGGWDGLDSHDYHQFIWRVSFSAYFAFFLLLALISIPFHVFSRLKIYDRAMRVTMVIVIVNSTLCVAVGLIVWFLLQRDPYDDSYKYAIVGGLQLWMLIVSQVGLCVVYVKEICCQKSKLYTFTNQNYSEMSLRGVSDRVSVSDGDATLNSAMTSGYYE